jgi:hypothetical protein
MILIEYFYKIFENISTRFLRETQLLNGDDLIIARMLVGEY